MPNAPVPSRHTAETIIFAGCLIALITFGPRAAVGMFQIPMRTDYGWGPETFGFAIALQNLIWGIGSPIAGMLADRHGVTRVLWAGACLIAAGLVLWSFSNVPWQFHLGAGVLIGTGLACASFNLVIGAFGKLLESERRALAIGAATASGAMGQFLFPPGGAALISNYGWHSTLITFGSITLLVVPLAAILNTARPGATAKIGPTGPHRSPLQVFKEALSYKSYVLLVLGFFTCGFHVAFITAHLPAYIIDRGLSAEAGGWTLALIGLANAVGSLSSGWLCSRVQRRFLLACIYFGRSIIILTFILTPISFGSCMAFGVAMGILWLSTVPPTSSLVMTMFGTRNVAMLYGFAFFSHQVGGSLGVWLGGIAVKSTGSYDLVWQLSIALGIISALLNLPIRERPAQPLAAAE